MKLKNCTKNILEQNSKANCATTHICKGKDYVFPFFFVLTLCILEYILIVLEDKMGKKKKKKKRDESSIEITIRLAKMRGGRDSIIIEDKKKYNKKKKKNFLDNYEEDDIY